MTIQRSGSDYEVRSRAIYLADSVDIVLEDDDVYRLVDGGRTVGFVRDWGGSFVSYAGESLVASVEVCRGISFDRCVGRVVGRT